jgi:hypothetical protein
LAFEPGSRSMPPEKALDLSIFGVQARTQWTRMS